MPEWTEIATLDSGTTDFGAVVQIDGNYLITSDNNNVYIYEKTTKGNKWELNFTHPNMSVETEPFVSISGNYAVSCNTGEVASAIVYFYQKNNKGNWEISQTLPSIAEGWGTISISGNYVIITIQNPSTSTGEFRVFQRNTKVNKWELDQTVKTDIDVYDHSGDIPSISGNYLTVTDIDTSGLLDIYEKKTKGNKWEFLQRLIGVGGTDSFGAGHQISGNHLIVSASGADKGTLYIYERNAKDKNWHRVFSFTDPEADSAYGYLNTVSISGNFAMAGNNGFGGATGPGRIYFFQKKNDGTWYNIQSIIGEGTDAAGTGEGIGGWVSISGNYASTNSVYNDKVYIYDFKF